MYYHLAVLHIIRTYQQALSNNCLNALKKGAYQQEHILSYKGEHILSYKGPCDFLLAS